jgi:hypothetical protein
MYIPDLIFESLETIFSVKIFKFFGGSGFGIRNPFNPGSGLENSDPGYTSSVTFKMATKNFMIVTGTFRSYICILLER